MKITIAQKSTFLILLVLLVDQASKIYVKTHFSLGEYVEVFSWFQIRFVENNGMAFGMEVIGKLFLTIFRLIAVGTLIYYIRKLIKKGFSTGYILTVSLILAGAAGNILDSLYFGVVFSDSWGHVASVFPQGGGYAAPLYGKVVDMLYFPLIKDSMGETLFLSPIFNIADSAISVAVVILFLFYRKDLDRSLEKIKENEQDEQVE
jgi:signal peptidase II